MADITGAAYLDALVTALEGNATVDGGGTVPTCRVYSAPLGPQDTIGREMFIFLDIDQTDDQLAMGDANRLEVYTLSGIVSVQAIGAGNAEAKTARDRAVALYGAMKAEIYGDIDLAVTGVKASEVVRYSLRQIVAEEGRFCIIDFDIEITATNE